MAFAEGKNSPRIIAAKNRDIFNNVATLCFMFLQADKACGTNGLT